MSIVIWKRYVKEYKEGKAYTRGTGKTDASIYVYIYMKGELTLGRIDRRISYIP